MAEEDEDGCRRLLSSVRRRELEEDLARETVLLHLQGEEEQQKERGEEREESVTMAAANELANFSSESNISTEWNNFAQIETFANPDNSTIRASLASTNWSATSSPASNVSNNTEEPFVILNGKVSHAK